MTARDRDRMRHFASELASRESSLRAAFRRGDTGALELAEHQRRMRESIEGELQAEKDRLAQSCAGETLRLFEE